MITDRDIYLDEEVEEVVPFERPTIRFSHIEPDNTGLRGYQIEMKQNVYDLWDKMDNVMLQMPTGTGKTVVFSSIVKDILRWCLRHSKDSKILIVAHRRELISQASDKLMPIRHGKIMRGEPLELRKSVQVASIQTFMSRRHYEQMRRLQFDFIIIDEAHHSMASGYQKLWKMFPHSKKLGVTATPWRMSQSGFTTLFGDIVLSRSVEWFISHGYLSNYDYISIKRGSFIQRTVNSIDSFGADGDYMESELSRLFDKDKIRAELYKSYWQFAYGKKGIIYAIDRRHAHNICDLYASRGVRVCMIDGTTPRAERDALISSYKRGSIQVIVNVNIFSEGFDCPEIEFIQLARPTKSLSLYLQQVGRGLRVSSGKERAVILDNVGLYNRFGTPLSNRHWRYHFKGNDDGKGFNDGVKVSRDLVDFGGFREHDYSEDSEEMEIVEHAEGKKQIYADDAKCAIELSPYNIFREKGKYGVCNEHNRTIIPPIYDDMHPCYNGYIPFKQSGKWGIMLTNGTVKIAAKYFYIGSFKNGRAEVQNTPTSEKYYINGNLERLL